VLVTGQDVDPAFIDALVDAFLRWAEAGELMDPNERRAGRA